MNAPSSRNETPVVGIVGWKNSGKTTLVTRLVSEFTRRGVRVATVKHAHHDFRIDDGETDSARHRRAGAGQVAVVSSSRWALITELAGAPEPRLADVLGALAGCDLVLVEGYKSEPIAKIEVRRSAAREQRPLSADDPAIFAIATDHAVAGAGAVPVFGLDDVSGLADLITRRMLRVAGAAGGAALPS